MRLRCSQFQGPRCQGRPGISLLEVLVALAIFLFSIVVISQMVDTAARTAQRAQRLSRAGLLAESVLSELAAGVRQMSSTSGDQVVEGDAHWTATIAVQPEAWSNVDVDGQFVAGLNSVQVTVTWSSGYGDEVSYTVSRVLLDPRVQQPNPNLAASTPRGKSGATTGGTAAGGTTP